MDVCGPPIQDFGSGGSFVLLPRLQVFSKGGEYVRLCVRGIYSAVSSSIGVGAG